MVFPIVGGTQDTSFEITNSLRFDNDTSTQLLFTPSSASNRRTYTISLWVKRGDVGTQYNMFGTASEGDNLYFESGGKLGFFFEGSSESYLITNKLFRDPAAWYNIVIGVDTTDGTAANRVKLYINGSQYTWDSSTTYPSQNYDSDINNNQEQKIGNGHHGALFDGYIADFNLIDGQQLDASSFGETDDNGVWIPKDTKTLTFGTNGYRLEFKQTGTSQNASGIGADTSGQDNHWAVSNFAADHVTTDTPSNNFCTINPIYRDDGNNMVAADFQEANTKQLTTVDGWKFGRGTFLLNAGKWYVEFKATEAGNGQDGNFGIVPVEGGVALGNTDDNDVFEGVRVSFSSSSTVLNKLDTGSATSVFTNFSSGTIGMMAIDLDNNKLWVGSNGTWYNNNNASTTLSSGNHDIALPTQEPGWLFGTGMSRNGSDNITWEYNWGQPSFSISSTNADANGHGNFEFAVPSGFFAVCTKNLAEHG